MWFIKHKDQTLQHRGNDPDHNILADLKKQHPAAEIYRSKKPCANDFGAAMFHKQWVKTGEETEIIKNDDETETRITRDVMTLERLENKYIIEEKDGLIFAVVLHLSTNDELARFEIETMHA